MNKKNNKFIFIFFFTYTNFIFLLFFIFLFTFLGWAQLSPHGLGYAQPARPGPVARLG
jgi:hypothetical protein